MLSGPPASLAASIEPLADLVERHAAVAEDRRDLLVGHDREQAVGAEQVALAARRA